MQAVWIDSPKTCYSHNGQELGGILGVSPISPTVPSSGSSDLYKYSIRTLTFCPISSCIVNILLKFILEKKLKYFVFSACLSNYN